MSDDGGDGAIVDSALSETSGDSNLDSGGGHDGALCAAHHDLCDDFDTPPFPNLTNWTTFTVTGGGEAGAGPPGLSDPNSFSVFVPALVDTSPLRPNAMLKRQFGGNIRGVACALDVRLVTPDAGGAISTLIVDIPGNPDAGISGWQLRWYN